MLVHPNDNVAILLEDAKQGDSIEVNGTKIILATDVAFGHKATLADCEKGALIYKYGEEIGFLSQALAAGTWVHNHNMDCRRGK